MQIDKKDYDPALHDCFRALCVRQPWADLLTVPVRQDEFGAFHADKEVEIRSKRTNYRGDLLICASAKPVLPGRPAGCTVGLVELYDCKPVREMTPDEWADTCIPERDRPREGYGWFVRNPRRVVEMPVKGQLGIYTIVVPKDDILEYPRYMEIDRAGWEYIKNNLRKDGKE